MQTTTKQAPEHSLSVASKIKQDTITSLQLLEQINLFRGKEGKNELKHNTLLRNIRDEFEEEIGEYKIVPTSYQDIQNKTQIMFNLTIEQAQQ